MLPADNHWILRNDKPDCSYIPFHEHTLNRAYKYIQTLSKSLNRYTSNMDKKYISHITTLCTIYILHLVTIKAFGLIDTNYFNRWEFVNIKQVTMNSKHQVLCHGCSPDKVSKLFDEYKKQAQDLYNDTKYRNTAHFNNSDHSQKLKYFKGLHKTYNDTETHLLYNDKWTPKNTALSEHYKKVSGPKTDPNNPILNDIKLFNKSLNRSMINPLQFIPFHKRQRKNPIVLQCVCDEFLISKVININTHNSDIICNHCKNNITTIYSVMYQCPDSNLMHPDGYHLCQECAINLNNASDEYDDDDDVLKKMPPEYRPKKQFPDPKNIINDDTNIDIDGYKDHEPLSVNAAISAANVRGTPGFEYITTKHLKLNRFSVTPLLCHMYNVWNQTFIVPYYIRIGSITSILKRPGGNTPNDFRPISLLPVVFKIYERLLLWEMSITYKLRSNLHILQGGNRRKRGVTEQIGTLHVIAETAKKSGKPLYCAFLDIKKAFDTVWRTGMFYKLHKNFNIPKYLCKSLKAIYKNSQFGIRNIPFIFNMFETYNGVLQGSVLSPVLFATFIDDLVTNLNNSQYGATTPVPNERIACIAYADDLAVLSHNAYCKSAKHIVQIGHIYLIQKSVKSPCIMI